VDFVTEFEGDAGGFDGHYAENETDGSDEALPASGISTILTQSSLLRNDGAHLHLRELLEEHLWAQLRSTDM